MDVWRCSLTLSIESTESHVRSEETNASIFASEKRERFFFLSCFVLRVTFKSHFSRFVPTEKCNLISQDPFSRFVGK